MTFKKLEEIEVWKRSRLLAIEVYRRCGNSPIAKDWGLWDQIKRSAISIPSNIAEGYERDSNPEFKRFLLIAKGSCAELRTQLDIADELNLIPKDAADYLLKECIEISSMLQRLTIYLMRASK